MLPIYGQEPSLARVLSPKVRCMTKDKLFVESAYRWSVISISNFKVLLAIVIYSFFVGHMDVFYQIILKYSIKSLKGTSVLAKKQRFSKKSVAV